VTGSSCYQRRFWLPECSRSARRGPRQRLATAWGDPGNGRDVTVSANDERVWLE